MTVLLALASVAATWCIGAIACAVVLYRTGADRPGQRAFVAGAAYPIGALIVAGGMHLLALSGFPASTLIAVAPIVAAIALAAWLGRARLAAIRWHDARAALTGRFLPPSQRWLWITLVAWIALRFLVLGLEVASRPPLPWEAWLHAAARARIWYVTGVPGSFVTEPVWWQAGGYLAGLAGGSPTTPALDAWTTFAMGRFDDTSLHLPWLAFLASQSAMAYAALRMLRAAPIAALGAGAIVATLPLSNAHAALGGTGALWVASAYLGAFALAWRASLDRSPRDAVLASMLVAATIGAGGTVGALFAATLAPFALARLRSETMRKVFGALVLAAILGVIVVARNALFVPPALKEVPLPGMMALAHHAFFLGNWHLLAYGAVAVALLAWRDWREPERLPATVCVALGVVVVIAVATSPAGRALVGSTGSIGHAGTMLAPVLAVWTAAIAHAWWLRDRAGQVIAHEPGAGEPGVATAGIPHDAA